MYNKSRQGLDNMTRERVMPESHHRLEAFLLMMHSREEFVEMTMA